MILLQVGVLVIGGVAAACGGGGGTETTMEPPLTSGGTPEPVAWTELAPTGAVPDPRSGMTLVYEPAGGRFLLFGGWDQDTDFGDTWAYDPLAGTWSDLAPAGALPAPRSLYQMAYDEVAGKAVVFGGTSDAGRFGDTWLYDPVDNTWSEVVGAPSPEARSAGAMVYLDDTEMILLFGGVGDAGRFADTWVFLSASGQWIKVAPYETVPLARSGHAMAYDTSAGKVILFGGYDGSNLLNDTWAYDPQGDAWTELSPSGNVPSPRGNHRMVFDASAGRMVLFGGFDGSGELSDTWTYDTASNTWTEVQVPGDTPTGREEHTLGYDPKAGRVLLFGGFDASDTDLNDLWALTMVQ